MSVVQFQYLWDNDAELLLVSVPPTSKESGFVGIQVESANTSETFAFCPLDGRVGPKHEMMGRSIAMVRIPRIQDGEALALHVTGVPVSGASAVSETLELLAHPSGDGQGKPMGWVVVEMDPAHFPVIACAELDRFGASGSLATRVLSVRDGNNLYPASADQTRQTVSKLRVDCLFDPQDEAIQLTCRYEDAQVQTDQLHVSVLSARMDVLPCLLDEATIKDRLIPDNHTLRARDATTVVIPDYTGRKPETMPEPLCFLDRIVIQTDTPTDIEIHYGGEVLGVGRAPGIAVLAYRADGILTLDQGKLVDLILDKDHGAADEPLLQQTLGAEMPNIQQSDWASQSELVCFAFQWCRNRILAQFPSLGSHFAPRTLTDFLKRPTFYWCLGTLDPSFLDENGQEAVAQISRNTPEADTVTELSLAVFMTAGLAEEDARARLEQAGLSAWDALFLATAPLAREGFKAGIVPGPGMMALHFHGLEKRRAELATLSDLHAQVAAFIPEERGVAIRLNKISQQITRLETLKPTLEQAFAGLLERLGLDVGAWTGDLLSRGAVLDPHLPLYFANRLANLAQPPSEGAAFDSKALRRQVSRVAAELVEDEYRTVRRLERVGFPNPVTGGSAPGWAEKMQAGFQPKQAINGHAQELDPALKLWLDTPPQHPVVKEWWEQLQRHAQGQP